MRWFLLSLIATLSLPLAIFAYTDAPMPNRTGGFGGPTCQACHTGNDLNVPGGELTITGLPERYTPGETYRITVALKRAELHVGGFSLTSRFASGALARSQAGEWQASDPRVTFHADVQTKVRYAQQTASGSRAATVGALRWELDWKAPQDADPVQFNVAANASNNDASPLGDYIYTREVTVPAALR
jgi:hypothetical protein